MAIKKKPYARWFLLALLGLPAIVPFLLIWQYGVDFPYMDQWDVGPALLDKAAHHELTLGNLFAQHNEHRIVFTRLVLLALAPLTHWNVKADMVVGVLLACFYAINVYLLCRRTVGGSFGRHVALCFVANLLLFGPIQMENWLWGMQIQFFVPAACLTAGLVVAGSRARQSTRFLACIGLATISTYSTANGMFAWGLLLPQLLINPQPPAPEEQPLPRRRRSFLAGVGPWVLAWVAAAALNVIFYFHDYVKPPTHPSLTEGFTHPLQFLGYFLAFLGSPLAFGTVLGPVKQSITVGAIMLLMFLGVTGYAIYVWRRRHGDTRLIRSMLPWILTAIYSLATAAITAVGRLGFGIEQGLSSRYTTLAIFLVVSLIFLIPQALDYAAGIGAVAAPAPIRPRSSYGRTRFLTLFQIGPVAAVRIVAGLGGALIVLHLFSSDAAMDFCEYTRIRRLEGKACLLFVKQFAEDQIPVTVSADVQDLPARAEVLQELGYLKPSLIETKKVMDILGAEDMGVAGNFGNIDNLQGNGKDQCLASGWAVFPKRRQAADAVILTWQFEGGSPTIFAVAEMGTPRNDVVEKFGNSAYQRCGWGKVFSAHRLPIGNLTIRAWAFDTSTAKAYALTGAASVHNNP